MLGGFARATLQVLRLRLRIADSGLTMPQFHFPQQGNLEEVKKLDPGRPIKRLHQGFQHVGFTRGVAANSTGATPIRGLHSPQSFFFVHVRSLVFLVFSIQKREFQEQKDR